MEDTDTIQSEVCQVCGDIGHKDSIMTCFNCREIREHIYCARVRFRSVPYMWLCEDCRSSTSVLHIPKLVDYSTKALDIHKDSLDVVKEEIYVPPVLGQTTSDPRLHSPSHGLSLFARSRADKGKGVAMVSHDTSRSKKQRQESLVLTSPKRKRKKTIKLVEGSDETISQIPKSSPQCVSHRL